MIDYVEVHPPRILKPAKGYCNSSIALGGCEGFLRRVAWRHLNYCVFLLLSLHMGAGMVPGKILELSV